MMNCDADMGACSIVRAEPEEQYQGSGHRKLTVRYVGDPMCSWCWRIPPAVHGAAEFCALIGVQFSITMGGLRAGGGDPWDAGFKKLIRNEWQHVSKVTGQPFGYSLLDAEDFYYDTEPFCRAVATVQDLLLGQDGSEQIVLRFFSAVQKTLYVDGHDATCTGFYEGPCAEIALDYGNFLRNYEATEARNRVNKAFSRCRHWGVRSFPTVLIKTIRKQRYLQSVSRQLKS
ncbi:MULTISPECIES: DsbA family protein [unclassified Pseudomonas]|uniref:DsbA family protein n=1 Tax=unclassified Pseudomonas TaxID=196821 RepID=UPI0018FE2F97|nr:MULTISPECIES: protein-disulfide isomerase [unclassified Pseudomonas]